MNIGVHIFFQLSVFRVFGFIPRSRIAGSQGSFIEFIGGCWLIKLDRL